MKITKRYLERMIKEELKNVLLSEQWTAAQIAEFENTHMRDPDDREQAMGFDAAMTGTGDFSVICCRSRELAATPPPSNTAFPP